MNETGLDCQIRRKRVDRKCAGNLEVIFEFLRRVVLSASAVFLGYPLEVAETTYSAQLQTGGVRRTQKSPQQQKTSPNVQIVVAVLEWNL